VDLPKLKGGTSRGSCRAWRCLWLRACGEGGSFSACILFKIVPTVHIIPQGFLFLPLNNTL